MHRGIPAILRAFFDYFVFIPCSFRVRTSKIRKKCGNVICLLKLITFGV